MISVVLLERLRQNSLYSVEQEKLAQLEAAAKEQLDSDEGVKQQLGAAEPVQQQLETAESLKAQLEPAAAVKQQLVTAKGENLQLEAASHVKQELELAVVNQQLGVLQQLEAAEAVLQQFEAADAEMKKQLVEEGGQQQQLRCQLCEVVPVTRLQLLEHYSAQHFREELVAQFSKLGMLKEDVQYKAFDFCFVTGRLDKTRQKYVPVPIKQKFLTELLISCHFK